MNSLTKELVDELIEELKILKDQYINFPMIKHSKTIEIFSENHRHKFELILNRKITRPDKQELKITYALIYERNNLIRIDINGAEHKNPEVALEEFDDLPLNVPCPHIHIFNEKFNIAFPLEQYIKYKDINNVSDLIEILIAFLNKINVRNLERVVIAQSFL